MESQLEKALAASNEPLMTRQNKGVLMEVVVEEEDGTKGMDDSSK